MTAVPIPAHELKSDTWYYGVRCACERLLLLVEDYFQGKGNEQHLAVTALEVRCECGAVNRTLLLQKFRTPSGRSWCRT